tara:strand:- start:433 stop:2025 length:1593 start_codon:yes stop_codon:yes gene_type:complete
MEEEGGGRDFATYVIWSLSVTAILLLLLPMIFVIGKSTQYSAYSQDGDYEGLAQLSDMRDSLEERPDEYFVANTMSTPMLVNDWKYPHRTMLLIIAPEKPIDETEADSIYDFVTERGGKVIVAADDTNANRLANRFGVTYFDAPLLDENQYYVTEPNNDGLKEYSWSNVWSVGTLEEEAADAGNDGCSTFEISQYNDGCSLPVLFRNPTGLKFEQTEMDRDDPDHRVVTRIAKASPSAFIDLAGNGDSSDYRNPAPGDLSLMIRVDYAGVSVYDKVRSGQGSLVGGDTGELDVTGSIVFVSDPEAFSNLLWDDQVGEEYGIPRVCEVEGAYQSCWNDEFENTEGSQWNGNEDYFKLLIHSMMEFDNQKLSGEIKDDFSNFQIVFDESRHVTGIVSAPFVEAMGTVVLLTSNTFLKWLVVLNVGLLLLVAMMIVPEKENWRHVFDLTRFAERPNKLDPSSYRQRVQQALFTKIRVHHDLTRDEMALMEPSKIQGMIGNPRLVELAYSKEKKYSPQELRELMKAIRRWGRAN